MTRPIKYPNPVSRSDYSAGFADGHRPGEIDRLRTALGYAKEKLKLYRSVHSGEYVGGIEYEALMLMIDNALER